MTPDRLTEAYVTMLTIRRAEERVAELRAKGDIVGSVHLGIGQEAIAVGAVAARRPIDPVYATYRGHAWALACGTTLEGFFGELMGRASGVNQGRGGSAYFTDPDVGFMGENSIVGAGAPIAGGAALAAQARATGEVALCVFGDGAMNQGAVHEALNLAAMKDLPVVFVCENNRYSELTPIADTVRDPELHRRAAGYGMPGVTVDGNDVEAVAEVVGEAMERARRGEGPTLVEAHTERLVGHYIGDPETYRAPGEVERAREREPLVVARARLLGSGAGEADLTRIEKEVEAAVEAGVDAAFEAPLADPAGVGDHVVGRPSHSTPPSGVGKDPAMAREEGPHRELAEGGETLPASLRSAPLPTGEGKIEGREPAKLNYIGAVNQALRRALVDWPEALLFGEDVAKPGGVFGASKGLRDEFGERVFDTPISEAAILGAAVGSAVRGMRPIAEIMWVDFSLVALDQIVNQAANVRYVSSGRLTGPLTVRTQQGVLPGSCAQHSQSLEAFFAHVPGLSVALPATPQDAYDLLLASIASNDPAIVIEHRSLYLGEPVSVDLDGPIGPVGGAAVRRAGSDVTVVTWGAMCRAVLEAAEQLADEGIDTEVIDLRWLRPLDMDTVADSVARTSRLVVAHEANVTGGFGAEVVARITESCLEDLDSPPRRLGLPDLRVPAAPHLQQAAFPGVEDIVEVVRQMARY